MLCRQYEDKLGSMYDIASTFSSEKGLVEVPSTWRRSLESCPKATCWYPAHIGCQVSISAAPIVLPSTRHPLLKGPMEGGLWREASHCHEQ